MHNTLQKNTDNTLSYTYNLHQLQVNTCAHVPTQKYLPKTKQLAYTLNT